MGCGGPLSSVMMIAGAGMLPGVGGAIPGIGSALGVNPNLVSNLGNFNNLGITNQFSNIVSTATGTLGSGTLDSLRTLGANIMPSLTNAVPGDFSSVLNVVAPGGMSNGGFTGLISSTASGFMGGGDLSQFGQIFGSAQGYLDQANQFINSNLNLSNLSSTFGPITGGMDNLLTGSLNQVTQAFPAFGGDLSKLGNLIDMNNLSSLGDPSALVKQLASVGGIVPSIENVLRSAGLDTSSIAKIATGGFGGLTDSANKILYEGMTKITGSELAQVKSILGVTTPNINSMADLLNPTKILPNSFSALTMPTPDGLRGIYTTTTGAVNTNLEKYLVDPRIGLPINENLITNARQGLSAVGGVIGTTQII